MLDMMVNVKIPHNFPHNLPFECVRKLCECLECLLFYFRIWGFFSTFGDIQTTILMFVDMCEYNKVEDLFFILFRHKNKRRNSIFLHALARFESQRKDWNISCKKVVSLATEIIATMVFSKPQKYFHFSFVLPCY